MKAEISRTKKRNRIQCVLTQQTMAKTNQVNHADIVVAMEIHNSEWKCIEHKQNFVKRHTQKLLFDRCSAKKLGFPYLILRRKAEHQAVGKCELFSPLISKFGCRKRKTNNFTNSHHVKIESHNNENQNKIKQWHVMKASSSKYTSLGSVAIVEQS